MRECSTHAGPRFGNGCDECREALLGDAAEPGSDSIFLDPDGYRSRVIRAGRIPTDSSVDDDVLDEDEGGSDRSLIVRCRSCRILLRTRRRPGEPFRCPRCRRASTLQEEQVEEEVVRTDAGALADVRACPRCGGEIKVRAVICKHCQGDVAGR